MKMPYGSFILSMKLIDTEYFLPHTIITDNEKTVIQEISPFAT